MRRVCDTETCPQDEKGRMMTRTWHVVTAGAAAILLASCLTAGAQSPQTEPAPSSETAGTIQVTFLYMPPTTIDPTYHTAMWLEDAEGKLVTTLYVSQELSSAEYKMGNVCPDWVKLAKWDEKPKDEIDAVTAPTPNVGSEARTFDLAHYGIKPGEYIFKFQMHVHDDHNVLFRGKVTVGGPDQTPKLEKTEGPGELVSTDQYVREVQVRYLPAAK